MDPDRFAALGHLASQVDSEAPPSAEEAAQQQREAQRQADTAQAQAAEASEAEDWAAVPWMIGQALGMFAPKVRAVYTRENCLRWGVAMVPVARKHGWASVGNIPELGLIVVTASLALPTYALMRAEAEEEKGGPLAKLRAWWAERKAKQLAKRAGLATGEPGGTPGTEAKG